MRQRKIIPKVKPVPRSGILVGAVQNVSRAKRPAIPVAAVITAFALMGTDGNAEKKI
jgi:hypothetical protein